MKRLDFIFILLIMTIPVSKTFATSQMPDILIYNGDTLSLFANPLEQLYDNDSIRPKFFGGNEGCESTACWRGYQAEWIIIDENLYLTGIYSCCYYEDSIKADLKKLFGNKFINGRVKADWFTGDIIAPQGKLLYYIHMDYESLYEKEIEFQVKNGKLTGKKTYDNSKSRQSDYSQDQDKLVEFIYSNINWSTLPTLDDKKIMVFVQFSANEHGNIDSVKVMRCYDNIFDQEAIRIVKAIPEWDIYYRHGKHERMKWTFAIVFSEDNKRKYEK